MQRSPSQVKGERVRTVVHSTKDSRSFPVGVRRFKSDPLHHILKMTVERVNYIGPETLVIMDVIRLGSHDS